MHVASGKAYQLTPGTEIEIERPNLFFNDYGEQSLPVDLPDTDLNRRLLNYPDMLANRHKPAADVRCTLQHGDFYMPCRQAVLGAKRKEKITTSFFMNEGSFLSRISKVSLFEVFGEETVPGVDTVQQGIEWCWSLRTNQHPDFAIFPIIVELDGERRFVNRINRLDADGKMVSKPNGEFRFFNSFERKEKVDGRYIKLEPGYYISPFVRAAYVLRRIFSYFGYELQEHFLTTAEPFSKMVFINNTIDSLVNGTIMLAHLVPNCTCSTILDVYRRRFCCEFIPDEVHKTVRMELFKDIADSKPVADLTPYLASQPELSFAEPRQLKLSSEEVISDGGASFDSVAEIEAQYPEAWYNPADGGYYHTGYGTHVVDEMVSDGNIPYYAGGSLKEYEVKVPDSVFSKVYMEYAENTVNAVPRRTYLTREFGCYAPYVGEGRTLNSTISGMPVTEAVESGETSGEDVLAKTPKQKPMLALVGSNGIYAVGTNHDEKGKWGYSLLYNGPVGIYEKFYRRFDDLLRNSLHVVSAEFLLSDSMKQSLPAHAKVHLAGSDLFFNVLRYSIGGKFKPVEGDLLTTALYSPVISAKLEEERLPRNTEYKWMVKSAYTEVTEQEYIDAGYAVEDKSARYRNDVPLIFPLPPTPAVYNAGGRYYERAFYSTFVDRHNKRRFHKDTVWLIPALFPEEDPNERPRLRTRTAL